MVEEKIVMVTEHRDMATGSLKKLTNQVQILTGTTKTFTTTVLKPAGAGLRQVSQTVKTMTGNFRRFQMEQLSVMFGAMMVSKALSGLLQPALQSVGVFSLWGDILEVTFLPTAMSVLDGFMIPLVDTMLSLDPAVQKVIGGVVLFGSGLSSVVEKGASFTLFAAGLMTVFEKLPSKAQGTLLTLGAIAGKITLIGLAIGIQIASLKKMWENWDTIWTNMRNNKAFAAILYILGGPVAAAEAVQFFGMGLFKNNKGIMPGGGVSSAIAEPNRPAVGGAAVQGPFMQNGDFYSNQPIININVASGMNATVTEESSAVGVN